MAMKDKKPKKKRPKKSVSSRPTRDWTEIFIFVTPLVDLIEQLVKSSI